jgi:hypothetical protein
METVLQMVFMFCSGGDVVIISKVNARMFFATGSFKAQCSIFLLIGADMKFGLGIGDVADADGARLVTRLGSLQTVLGNALLKPIIRS